MTGFSGNEKAKPLKLNILKELEHIWGTYLKNILPQVCWTYLRKSQEAHEWGGEYGRRGQTVGIDLRVGNLQAIIIRVFTKSKMRSHWKVLSREWYESASISNAALWPLCWEYPVRESGHWEKQQDHLEGCCLHLGKTCSGSGHGVSEGGEKWLDSRNILRGLSGH